MSMIDLELMLKDKSTSVIDALIGRVLAKGLSDASTHELNYFIERFHGKVTENHHFSGGSIHGALVDFINAKNQTPKELQHGQEDDEE